MCNKCLRHGQRFGLFTVVWERLRSRACYSTVSIHNQRLHDSGPAEQHSQYSKVRLGLESETPWLWPCPTYSYFVTIQTWHKYITRDLHKHLQSRDPLLTVGSVNQGAVSQWMPCTSTGPALSIRWPAVGLLESHNRIFHRDASLVDTHRHEYGRRCRTGCCSTCNMYSSWHLSTTSVWNVYV